MRTVEQPIKVHAVVLLDGRRAYVQEYASGATKLRVGNIDHAGHGHPFTPDARKACREELRAKRIEAASR